MSPNILGILNVTPDSFSDGGRFTLLEKAVSHAVQMTEDGAAMVDVGGESTRPGAEPVSAEDEIARVVPVCEHLSRIGIRVSIDTSKAIVARAALDAGAELVNDVSGLRDPGMIRLIAERKCAVCIMHMQGEPRVMQKNPTYENVVTDVLEFLLNRAEHVARFGIPKSNIWIDPGIGFGKSLEHNLTLLKHLKMFVHSQNTRNLPLEYPVLLGVSRKSYLAKILGDTGAKDRLEGTLVSELWGASQGVAWIRTHDVKALTRALKVQQAILQTP